MLQQKGMAPGIFVVVLYGARSCCTSKGVTRPHADACLLLQSDKMTTLIEAAGVKVEPYWPGLFAKLFETANVGDLITNVGAGAEGCFRVTASAQTCFSRELKSRCASLCRILQQCSWHCVSRPQWLQL